MQTWIYLFISPDILSHVYQAEIFTGAFVFLTLSGLNIRYTTCRLGGEKLLQISCIRKYLTSFLENISDRGLDL